MLKGYDVASYQSGTDWTQVDADFVIIKATEGATFVDPLFDAHVVGALRRGIPWGGYHFARPTSNSPETEARHFVDKCGAGQVLPCLDVEKYGPNSSIDPLAIMGADALASWCDRWAVAVHSWLNQTPLFYSFRSYASQVAPRLVGPWAGVWLASASGDPNGAYLGRTYGSLRVVVEQYGQPTSEPGFPRAVDANVADPALLNLSPGDDDMTPEQDALLRDLHAKMSQDKTFPPVLAANGINTAADIVGTLQTSLKAVVNPDAFADAVVAKLGGSADVAAIKQAVKEALREGTG